MNVECAFAFHQQLQSYVKVSLGHKQRTSNAHLPPSRSVCIHHEYILQTRSEIQSAAKFLKMTFNREN